MPYGLRVEVIARVLSAAVTVAGHALDLSARACEEYAAGARWWANLTRCVP